MASRIRLLEMLRKNRASIWLSAKPGGDFITMLSSVTIEGKKFRLNFMNSCR